VSAVTGIGALTGVALRRDRFKLPAYVLGLALLMAGMLAGIGGQSPAALAEQVTLFADTPALRIFGVASGASEGATTMIRGYLLLGILAALLSALTVVRHTRQNEELGRAELLGAAAVGRHADLGAALSVALCANVLLGGALGLVGVMMGQPAAGSLTAGVAVAGLGAVFAGVAAVTVQLSATTRGAGGLAATVLGVSFVISAVGNMLGSVDATGLRLTSAWPAWLSPMGWGQQMRPYGGDEWWPSLALFVTTFLLLVGVAAVLTTRRDVGSSIFTEPPGRARAAPWLSTPFGLAWRLQRAMLLGWAVGLLGFAVVFGAIIDEMRTIGGTSAEWYARMGGSQQIVDAYRASVIAMGGMAVAIYLVQILLRMHTEEAEGRLEPVLAAAASRPRWQIANLLNAGLGALGLLLIFAVGVALPAGAVLGDIPAELRDMTAAALVQVPALLVIAGTVVLATAVIPHAATAVSWGLLLAWIVLGPLFGAATFQLPAWAQDISPFTHTPKLPAADLTALPTVGLTVIAAALVLSGLAWFRRRDLSLPA
jgi:ABC-2 type transport system permease protein